MLPRTPSLKRTKKQEVSLDIIRKSLEILHSSSKQALQDPDYVAHIIQQSTSSGTGLSKTPSLLIEQNPHELASALIHLSQFPISSYAEFGTCFGGTTALICGYLKKYNPELTIEIHDRKEQYQTLSPLQELAPVTYHSNVVYKAIKKRSYDLCFIRETDCHETIQTLYDKIGKHAKICMFHKTHFKQKREGIELTPFFPAEGVGKFWGNFKKEAHEDRQIFEFSHPGKAQSPIGFGIAISP